MKNSFYVISFDFNSQKVVPYDVIPYLVNAYKEKKKKDRPKTFEEFKKFVKDHSMYQWWSRCEYEIVVTGVVAIKDQKIDIYYQVLMNLDIITQILMNEILK